MKKLTILLVFLAIGIPAFAQTYMVERMSDDDIKTEEPVACTMDAKQCPDGSYVGRVGPDCQFKACPSEKEFKKDDSLKQYLSSSLYCQRDADCAIRESACGDVPMNIYYNNSELIAMQPYVECSEYIQYKNPRCNYNQCVADAV